MTDEAELNPEDALREAIASVVNSPATRQLSNASRELSQRYRGPRTGGRLVQTDAEVEAYAAARLPATFAALTHVFTVAASLLPTFAPASLLDLGAGTGAAAWAATAIWPGINKITLLENDEKMIGLGRRLHAADPRPGNPANWQWQQSDFTRANFESHDLVTASYALGELERESAISIAHSAWQATSGILVIIEPGTMSGFALMRQIRRVLIENGASLLAPCPHDRECPIIENDWCHFAARVPRSTLHRQLKGGQLAYEDEKFSYLAFTRTPAPRVPARVLRHPLYPPRQVHFVACTGTGIRNINISKSNPDFKPAKKLGWGDALPEEVLR
jgi:ribosomal protein RSM22 (predicted rRNA methylase)